MKSRITQLGILTAAALAAVFATSETSQAAGPTLHISLGRSRLVRPAVVHPAVVHPAVIRPIHHGFVRPGHVHSSIVVGRYRAGYVGYPYVRRSVVLSRTGLVVGGGVAVGGGYIAPAPIITPVPVYGAYPFFPY